MAQLEKVLWYEGMTLDPHHFQQWDRYIHGLLDARVRAVAPFGWGVTDLQIDKEAVANGQVNLLRATGVTRDGLPFAIPEASPRPSPRDINEHFLPTQDRLAVYVAVPTYREGGNNTLLPDTPVERETRFATLNRAFNDDTTGGNERSVAVAHANIQVRFGTEPLDEYTAVQIAEIIRTPEGGLTLDEAYIPPLLSVGASESLRGVVRRILELLVAKHGSLASQLRDGQNVVTRTAFTATLMSLTISGFIPVLNHFFSSPRNHPETLYLALVHLVGQLTTFAESAGLHPRSLPAYNHENLTSCFKALEMTARQLLGDVTFSKNYRTIPLERNGLSRYRATSLDSQVLGMAELYLTVQSDLPDQELIKELPDKLKLAAPENMDLVLQMAVRTLPISHVSRLPAGVPASPGALYFQFSKTGPYWDAISQSRALEIFLPTEFRDPSIELLAVLP